MTHIIPSLVGGEDLDVVGEREPLGDEELGERLGEVTLKLENLALLVGGNDDAGATPALLRVLDDGLEVDVLVEVGDGGDALAAVTLLDTNVNLLGLIHNADLAKKGLLGV